jgi:hypothetical protein
MRLFTTQIKEMQNMKKRLPFLLAIVILISSTLACGGSVATEAPTEIPVDAQTEAPVAATEAPGVTQAPGSVPDTWLVMMYEDADDEILEEDMVFDMNEAELVGSSDNVTVVAQMDRFDGGFAGDGDWTSTKRFLITQDDDLSNINSTELADLGEMDMGNSQTLQEFITWAINTYPAGHYALIMSDHGAGWQGGWSDHDSGNGLSMQEIDDALSASIADTGVGILDFIGFDACLMGQLESMSVIAPHARYAVGSEETEPALGWAYASFLSALNDNPGMSGGELGSAIVDGYINQDIQVINDQSRANSLSAGVTLTAVDLGAIPDLNAAVNDLAVSLVNLDSDTIAQARAYAQSYTSVWWDGIPPSYLDLGNFVELLLASTTDPEVTKAAQNVQSALAQAVIVEKHGSEKPASTGLTFYFPNSELYSYSFDASIGYDWIYTAYVGRFATASLWDDFLTYYYTGQTFDPASADLSVVTPAEALQTNFEQAVTDSAPEAGAEIAAPNTTAITIDPITVSASEIGPDGTVTLSTTITNSNIAYVYYYVAYYDETSNSYLTADQGYVEPGDIKEMSGVFYPDWGSDATISVNYDWEPTLYYMSDGNEANDQFAFFEPTVYGEDTSTDIYTVRGTYTFVDTGTEIDAEIDFNGDGDMMSVWGFTGDENSTGAWHELTPQKGDTFTITEEWLDFDVNPDGEFNDYNGGTMTFGDTPFTMVPYYAFSGSYALAIGVEDLDGNTYWEFVDVTVTE